MQQHNTPRKGQTNLVSLLINDCNDVVQGFHIPKLQQINKRKWSRLTNLE